MLREQTGCPRTSCTFPELRAGLVSPQSHRGADDSKEGNFNAAAYLSVSTRVSCCHVFLDLAVAKIIRHFRTPWPKRSYQHVSNAAQTCSNSQVILRQLRLHGAKICISARLFDLQPVLAFLPLFVIGLVAHFFIRATRATGMSRSTEAELGQVC
eukprot:gene22314-30557_t